MIKRVKINFGSINNGNYTVIDPNKIAESRARIAKNMKPKVMEFKRKMAQSMIDAQNFIINH